MKPFKFPAVLAGLVLIAISIPSAQAAASFVPFWFKTNVTANPDTTGNPNLLNDPTRDIRLDSVTYNGRTYNNFEVVNGANLLQIDTYTTGAETFGILNSGRGPNTVIDPLVTQGPSKPLTSAAHIIGSLGNLNLNSLIVTRESAPKASFEVSFANPINTIYFW